VENVKTRITHDAIIDVMLAQPRITRRELAGLFGFKSEASISIITSSDAFQARLAKRSGDIIDPILTATVEERIRGLAVKSAEMLAEALDKDPKDVKLALEVFKESSRAGSYGAKAAVAVQTNFVVHLPGPASSSAEWKERFAPGGAPVLLPRVDDAPSEGDQ
jgi:hypothetical protein